MRSESQANADMAAQAKHDRLHARQNAARLANEEYRTAKQHRNELFWHRVMRFISITVVLAVICKVWIIWSAS